METTTFVTGYMAYVLVYSLLIAPMVLEIIGGRKNGGDGGAGRKPKKPGSGTRAPEQKNTTT